MKVNQYAGAVIRLSGIVQGVGFRPFVFRNARRLRLKGSVQNTDTGILIKIDGARADIERFFEEIRDRPPALAEIHDSSLSFCSPHGFQDFTIDRSTGRQSGYIPISPDIATCEECLDDVFDPGNRRYLYPFTNCTNCGPRFTIIHDIPYDRKNTTMHAFPMCADCRREYEDPTDRRYHAQPNACPVCGPTLTLLGPDGKRADGNPLHQAAELLRAGRILAVKGLGGYHLAVDPKNDTAVERLRKRKRRWGKPFAMMARDLETVRRYCVTDGGSEALLLSVQRPIMLLQRKADAPPLSTAIAPDTRTYGMMLPYTPLHHLLFTEGPDLLVMTSANLSEEPLAYRDSDAIDRLKGIADAFLTHDREIERPCDDSVLLSVDGAVLPIRRSRGYVPRAIGLGEFQFQVFAAGASEKNTFCVIKEGRAYLSHHIGDLENEKSLDAYTCGVKDFMDMFRVSPDAVACDLHPDYMSTRIAREFAGKLEVPLFQVQHHHAHIASVLAEHGCMEKVIGVAFDGTGFGTDGTIWGGEFLLADCSGFERAGHYKSVPMPGGEKCILETDRMALAYLLSAFGSPASIPAFGFIDRFDGQRLASLEKIMSLRPKDTLFGQYCPLTSSCGRLFDAISALLGLCTKPAYDAQAAILMEKAAGEFDEMVLPYSYEIDEEGILNFDPMIREIVDDIRTGMQAIQISQKFHSTVVVSSLDMCRRIRDNSGLKKVAISGGVFQNRHISKLMRKMLVKEGFTLLSHRLVPPNDGGISLGQGMVTLHLLGGGCGSCA